MSGIWDRIIPAGELGDRCSAHLLKAAMHLSVFGVFTNQQLLDGINSKLTVPLSAAAESDLGSIRTAIAAQTTANRLVFLERFDAMNIAAEMGVLTNEATYRSELGI
jgi:hypothetical protein